jgi:hypothetical protein
MQQTGIRVGEAENFHSGRTGESFTSGRKNPKMPSRQNQAEFAQTIAGNVEQVGAETGFHQVGSFIRN